MITVTLYQFLFDLFQKQLHEGPQENQVLVKMKMTLSSPNNTTNEKLTTPTDNKYEGKKVFNFCIIVGFCTDKLAPILALGLVLGHPLDPKTRGNIPKVIPISLLTTKRVQTTKMGHLL